MPKLFPVLLAIWTAGCEMCFQHFPLKVWLLFGEWYYLWLTVLSSLFSSQLPPVGCSIGPEAWSSAFDVSFPLTCKLKFVVMSVF